MDTQGRQQAVQPEESGVDPRVLVDPEAEPESLPVKCLVNKPSLLISYLRKETVSGTGSESKGKIQAAQLDGPETDEELALGKRHSENGLVDRPPITEEEYNRAVSELEGMKSRYMIR